MIDFFSGLDLLKNELNNHKNMENQKVYLVTAHGGIFDDKWTFTVGIFSNKERAIEEAKKTVMEHTIIENNLPMTFDEWAKCNYGWPDTWDDTEEDEFGEYTGDVVDRDGHTKEEFKIMEKAQELQFENFAFCDIIEYTLDINASYTEQRLYVNYNTVTKNIDVVKV